jgi:predicted RNase H-like nuclease (RuvC/YqgF family)
MKAYLKHLEWVIQTQERITQSEQKVIRKDQTIKELLQERTQLQEIINISTREKRQLQERLESFINPLASQP